MKSPILSDTPGEPRIVSFDFDSTLFLTRFDEDFGVVEAGPNLPMLSRLRAHLAEGDTVWIVTSRRADQSAGVESFLAEHALDVAGVHFTSGAHKIDTLLTLGVTVHHDDGRSPYSARAYAIKLSAYAIALEATPLR